MRSRPLICEPSLGEGAEEVVSLPSQIRGNNSPEIFGYNLYPGVPKFMCALSDHHSQAKLGVGAQETIFCAHRVEEWSIWMKHLCIIWAISVCDLHPSLANQVPGGEGVVEKWSTPSQIREKNNS